MTEAARADAPAEAAVPVEYLICSEEMGEKTGGYMHMMRVKESSEASMDPDKGALLWAKAEALLREHDVL